MTAYTVKAGDSLSLIAQRYTGDPMRYRELLTANPSIANPDVIEPGQQLQLPAAWSTPAAAVPVAAAGAALAVVSKGDVWEWIKAHKMQLGLGLLVAAGVLYAMSRPKRGGGSGKATRKAKGRGRGRRR